MMDFEDVLIYILGIWGVIILFITCPLWGIPYIIYTKLKGGVKK